LMKSSGSFLRGRPGAFIAISGPSTPGS
jgi:hypothetical protein